MPIILWGILPFIMIPALTHALTATDRDCAMRGKCLHNIAIYLRLSSGAAHKDGAGTPRNLYKIL